MTPSSSSFILHPSSFRRTRRAFSLTEILVVIGILVVLMAILTPMIVKARRQAARTRQASDLQTIAVALDAYKADFGDYPRPFAPGAGFATLGYALVAPGPQNSTASPASVYDSNSKHYEPGDVVKGSGGSKSGPPVDAYVCIAHSDPPAATSDADRWTSCLWQDYFDGPGFRQRPQGQKYGPYLQADRFKLRGYALLDIWGNPILYFPARSGAVNVNKPNPMPPGASPAYVWDSRDPGFTPRPKPLYDVADNLGLLGGDASQPASGNSITARENLQVFLGDKDKDGWIGPGESAVTTAPYILWSAGPDAEGNPNFHYGLIDSQGKPDPNGKTDDVTNFGVDGSLLK